MTEGKAIARARELFLEDDEAQRSGCAETTLVVLQETFGLPQAADSSVAMAFSGGVAWSGGLCGALSGAAMAVGRQAGSHEADRAAAKARARCRVAALLDEFRAEFSSTSCRDLLGLDISTEEGHRAFIDSQVWHRACMAHIEFVVRRALALQDEGPW